MFRERERLCVFGRSAVDPKAPHQLLYLVAFLFKPTSRVAGIRNVQDGWGDDPSGSRATRADPAAILYCPEWRVLRTGIPKISPSSSWIQSTVASCMTSDQWSSSPHYSGKNIRCHFRCCLLLPESVAHNGLLEYFQLGHPIYSALKLALNFDMLAVDDALGNWHKLNSMRYQVANIIFVQSLTKYWNCE